MIMNRKSKVKQKGNGLDDCFFNPFCLLDLYLDRNVFIFFIQKLHQRIECDNTEGVEHGEDHPGVNHLDVGSHW